MMMTYSSHFRIDDIEAFILKLIQNGADVTGRVQYTDGDSAPYLHALLENNHYTFTFMTRIGKILLDAGADFNGKDYNAKTILSKACEEAQLYPLVEILLNGGADITTVDPNSVRFAVQYSRSGSSLVSLLRLLVEAGYPLNQAVDDAGNTLFHLFVENNDTRESDEIDVIDFFMEKADMFLKNHNGETAFHIAAKKKPHIMKHVLANCDNEDFCKVVSEMKDVEWECRPSLMVIMSRFLTMMAENQTRFLTMMAENQTRFAENQTRFAENQTRFVTMTRNYRS
jgi:ankyrin repeat protein